MQKIVKHLLRAIIPQSGMFTSVLQESTKVRVRKKSSCPRDTPWMQPSSKQRTVAVQVESGIYSHPTNA